MNVRTRRAWLGITAITLGVWAALLAGGTAHADDNSSGKASSQRASSKQQTASAATAGPRRGVAASGRPRAAAAPAADSSPYTGVAPNRTLQTVLLTIWRISTAIPGLNPSTPPAIVTRGLTVSRTELDGMPVYTLTKKGATPDQTIVAIHGGGYVGEIGLINWVTYSAIARDTGATVIVPVYPLAPSKTASDVVPQMANLMTQVIAARGADNVSVLGESAGGGLALAAIQQLVLTGAATPARMVLVAPWLDATVSDPASQTIKDPLLDVSTLRKYGLLWAGDLDPDDPLVSPINGSLSGLPTTYVYSGSRDLLSPDTLRLRDAATAAGLTNFTFILRNGEIHGWPAFPFLPSAIADRPAIERQLLGK